MSDLIEIVYHDTIAEVALNRPKAYNAFNLEMMTELANQLIHLSANGNIKGVVLTGRGKAFCAGGDLAWVSEYSETYGSSFHVLAAQFHATILEIRRMNKPVIAAINGAAAGGGFSMALACDFRVMEESAVLKQAYTSNGLCLDGGGTFTLTRLVGMAKALEIAAFDEAIPAIKALEWGLVTKTVENGKALEISIEMLNRLATGSLHSFGLVKRLITDSYNHTFETCLELEREALGECGNHRDGIEGINAFKEKRKPRF
ncbi:enoyl-CoA hydratase/isomerase family protein [bacterium]|nr:enoyl-CoA hydratase/isomerase family protein [bacterium]